MFWTVPLSIIRSFSLYTAMVCVTQLASRIRMELAPSRSCSQAVSKPVWHIPLLCAQWKTPDDGQRNCPKHVEFYSKNKFEKLVHLAGFIIRIYHDARSPERQICHWHIILPPTKHNLPRSYCTWYFPVLWLRSFEKYSVIYLSFLFTSNISIMKNVCIWHNVAYKINTSNWVCRQFNAHRYPAWATCHNCCTWQHVVSLCISCEPSSQGTFATSAHISSSCMCSLYFAMPKEQLRQSKTWWPGTVQTEIGTSSVTKMRHVPTLHLHLHNWHFFLPGITSITSNEHF